MISWHRYSPRPVTLAGCFGGEKVSGDVNAESSLKPGGLRSIH